MKFELNKSTVMNLLKAPSIIVLFLWMIVPLSMTLYFSVIRYNLLSPMDNGFEGLGNYEFFMTDAAFMPAVLNSLISFNISSSIGGIACPWLARISALAICVISISP